MWLCSGDPGKSQLKNARHNEIPLKRERERERKENEKEQTSNRESEKYKQNIPLKISLGTKIIKYVKKFNTEKDSQ